MPKEQMPAEDPSPNDWFEGGEDGIQEEAKPVVHPDDAFDVGREDEEIGGNY